MKIWTLSNLGELNLKQSTSLPEVVWPRAVNITNNGDIVLGTFGSSYASFQMETGIWNLRNIENTLGLNSVDSRNGAKSTVGDAGVVYQDGEIIARLGSCCNFVKDTGRFLLAGGSEGAVFEARLGLKLFQHSAPLNCCTIFSSNNRTYAAIGTYSGDCLIFDISIGLKIPQLEHKIKLHTNAIKGLASNEDSLFSVCATGEVSLHKIAGTGLQFIWSGKHDKIANGCCPLKGNMFASVSRDLTLRIWSDGRCETFATPFDHSIKCVASSADGRYVALGSYDGRVAIFDLENHEWKNFQQLSSFGISSVCFVSQNAAFVASCYDGRTYTLYI